MIAVLLLALTAQAETGVDVGQGALGGQTAFSTLPTTTASPTSAPWWTTFGDPALEQLIGKALSHNPDLAARVALEEQSRMNAASAWSGVLPSLSLDSSVSGSPTDALGFSFGGFSGPSSVDVLVGMETLQDIDGDGIPDTAFGPIYETFDVPVEDTADVTWNGSTLLNARWNLDVFGNQVATITASRHATRAAEGDTAATALTVATTVAGAWYDLVLTRARLTLVEEQVQANEQMLELVQLRYEAGSASGLDVLQQRQQLAATQALLPAASHGIRRTTYRLAVLLGEQPAALADRLTAGDTLPELAAAPDPGTPSDLLRDRPDVAAALARVDASVSTTKGTRRDALPALGVSANAGWQYFSQGEWDSTDIWGVGANASIPLFNGGRVYTQTRAAQAAERAAIEQARRAVLSAVHEVEDTLLFEQQAHAERAAAVARATAAHQAYEDARDRYVRGLIDLTTVLNTQTAWQTAALSDLQSQRTVLTARIQLHDALGGQWASHLATGEQP